MSQTFRALLIGTGCVADTHFRSIADTRGAVQLVAAVDVDQQRVRTFAERHKIPASYTDAATALRETRPDLVIIASPPATHAALTIAALEAGAWVLCEKPFCASLADLDRIEETEKRTGRFATCVFQQRFGSSNEHVRRIAASGVLGRPLVAVCNTLWYRDAAYYAVPWRGRWATELGGPTMGLGIHAMDQLLHLIGDWAEVRAQVATLDRSIEIEDVSMAIIRFANGALASVVNSALSPRQETYIRLDYQRATIELTHLYDYRRENWKLTPSPTAHNDGHTLMQAWENFPPETLSTNSAQLAALVENMRQNTRPLTSGDDARRTLELLAALYKSAFTGQPVQRGSIRPGDPFYAALHGGMGTRRDAAPQRLAASA